MIAVVAGASCVGTRARRASRSSVTGAVAARDAYCRRSTRRGVASRVVPLFLRPRPAARIGRSSRSGGAVRTGSDRTVPRPLVKPPSWLYLPKLAPPCRRVVGGRGPAGAASRGVGANGGRCWSGRRHRLRERNPDRRLHRWRPAGRPRWSRGEAAVPGCRDDGQERLSHRLPDRDDTEVSEAGAVAAAITRVSSGGQALLRGGWAKSTGWRRYNHRGK
jgi:hypothetical protein